MKLSLIFLFSYLSVQSLCAQTGDPYMTMSLRYGRITYSQNKRGTEYSALTDKLKPVYGAGFDLVHTIPWDHDIDLKLGAGIQYYHKRNRLAAIDPDGGDFRSHNYLLLDGFFGALYPVWKKKIILLEAGMSVHYLRTLMSKTALEYGEEYREKLSTDGFYWDLDARLPVEVNPLFHIVPYMSYAVMSSCDIKSSQLKVVFPYRFRWGIAAEVKW